MVAETDFSSNVVPDNATEDERVLFREATALRVAQMAGILEAVNGSLTAVWSQQSAGQSTGAASAGGMGTGASMTTSSEAIAECGAKFALSVATVVDVAGSTGDGLETSLATSLVKHLGA